ncbi:MAG: hypothetical protein Q4D13_05335, partial [Erysipelotrichaceae bacterium]|nr:hypothetical protein [Erysipelotrichaceae bacterium]
FKQIYLYILKGTVSLWDIPFQLCSIPIYYWLIYPKSKHKDILEAFLIDFNGLGAILSFLYPEGMIHKEVILTAHSFLFHDAVLFISLLTLFKGKGRCEFRKEIPFYLLLCLMAEIINFSLNGYGEIDMFYINPLVKMNQPVFKDIALYIGIPFTCVLYVFVLGLGAYIIHIFRRSVDLNN